MIIGLLSVTVVLLIVLIVMSARLGQRSSENIQTAIAPRFESVERSLERVERSMREEISKNREESATSGRELRDEVRVSVKDAADSMMKGLGEMSNAQKIQLDDFALRLNALTETVEQRLTGLREAVELELRNSREDVGGRLDQLRTDLSENATLIRTELGATLKDFRDSLMKQMAEISKLEKDQLDGFAGRLANLTESNERRLDSLRTTVDERLKGLQEENSKKLEQMRQTVDEKLQGTLEKRLGESFKLVSDRLEQVHKGLGEMQSLALGVGDLKKVLTNVKTRGTWGEIQLGNLLEQILAPEQYDVNVATKPGSNDRVEFAIKMPGQGGDAGSPVWLPIDAKFPQEDYGRIVEASERGDAAGVEAAARQLELIIKAAAKDIRDKYLSPPHTTDFGILFLPTEGLYAEVLRRAGVVERLQREYRVSIAGPTTLAALLNSLQMGFNTLAIQKRSSEVWGILGTVKNEFGKFGDVLDSVQKKLHEASNTIDKAGVRTRAIERQLRDVQEIPASSISAPSIPALLGEAPVNVEEIL